MRSTMSSFRICLLVLLQLLLVETIVQAHFVNSSGVPYPSSVRKYSTDNLDTKTVYEKGLCGCFRKLSPATGRTWTVCRGKECREVPRAVQISDRRLRVTGTSITSIRHADMADYSDLVELELDGNLLETIVAGSFINMNQLVNLSIMSNHLDRLPDGAFRGLITLQSLRLNKNRFQSLSDFSPALSDLPRLRTLKLSENTLGRVDLNDFVPLNNSKLEILELNNCELKYINSEAFLPLKNLTQLTLSVNIMPSDNLVHLFYTMRHSALRTLDLSHLGFAGSPPRPLLETLSRTQLRELDLSDNTLPRLNNSTFPLMPNIRKIDLSSCGIISIENDTFEQFPQLRDLNLARNNLASVLAAIAALPHLERLDMSQNSVGGDLELGGSKFAVMGNLTFLDLSANHISHVSPHAFLGLKRLRELHLSNCSIYRLEEGCFDPLESLERLYMDGNSFGKHDFNRSLLAGLDSLTYLNVDRSKISFTNQEGVFAGAPNLKTLSLKNNEIDSFGERNPFKDAINLVSIDLSHNHIRDWQVIIFNESLALEEINLAGNDISSVTEAMMADISGLSEVNLLDNPLDCDCQLLPLRRYVLDHQDSNESDLLIKADHCSSPDKWRFKPVVAYLLSLNDDHYCTTDDNGEELEGIDIQSIRSYMITLYIMIPLVAFLVLTGVLIYKNRWLIRLHLFRKRLSTNALVGEASNGLHYSYDAFVSYSNEDHHFVARMVTVLEDSPPHFKLCVYERDFTAGNVLNDCIVQSIATSRKVVLVVSEHFVQSHWCLWELHLAQHSLLEDKRNGLILVVVDKLRSSRLPPTLRYLMKTRIYLEWDPEPRKQQVFWERLRGALAPTSSSLASREGPVP